MRDAPRSTKPWYRRLGRFIVTMWRRMLSQPGAPERVALGAAIGFFIGWLPIMGVQMVVCLAICSVVRANFLATIPGVWLSNPVTVLPMYYFINQIGAWIAGQAISWNRMEHVFEKATNLGVWDGSIYLFTEMGHVTLAMFIGGAIVGLINAIIVYPIVLRLVRRYQRHRDERRAHWNAMLASVDKMSD